MLSPLWEPPSELPPQPVPAWLPPPSSPVSSEPGHPNPNVLHPRASQAADSSLRSSRCTRRFLRAPSETEDQYGFLRSTAMLAVIIVTDETDCSAAEDSIFLTEAQGGGTVFWSDPAAVQPTSACAGAQACPAPADR